MIIKLIENNGVYNIASWGEPYEIGNEILEKYQTGKYYLKKDKEFYLKEKENIKELQIQELQTEIKDINTEFDQKISDYLSKYPKREQDTFAEKKREAEKVLAGGESLYISEKAKALGVTAEQFAQKIIQKNNEWTQLYTQLENEKDMRVMEIEARILELKK